MDTIDWSQARVPAWTSLAYIALVIYGKINPAPKTRFPAGVVAAYNVIQVVWNLIIMGLIAAAFYESHHGRGVLGFYGAPEESWYTNKYLALAVYIYYVNKYADLFDTIIIVAHGKTEQLSFLHYFHHVSIIWCLWGGYFVFRAPDTYLSVVVNAFIHVVMYSFYYLTARKVHVPVFVKKSITTLQQIQFVLVCSQSVLGMAHYPSTSWAYTSAQVAIFETVSLFILFTLWRQRAYAQKTKKVA
eukprot:Opistho-1_new@77161